MSGTEKQPIRWPQVLLTSALIGISGGFVLGKFDKAEEERKAMAREIQTLKTENRHLRSDVAILQFLQSQDEAQLERIVGSLKQVYANQRADRQADDAQFADIAERLALLDEGQAVDASNFAIIAEAIDNLGALQVQDAGRLGELEKNQHILLGHEAWRLFQDWMWQQEQEQRREQDKRDRPWAYPPYEHEAGFTVLPPAAGGAPSHDVQTAPVASTPRNLPEHSL